MRRIKKILAAAVLGLLSPLFCLAGGRSALDIYADSAARELDAYAASVAEQNPRSKAAAPATAPAKEARRGLEVENASGLTVDIFSLVPGKPPVYVDMLIPGEKAFLTCRGDKAVLTFKGKKGYEARVEAQFRHGSVSEVQRVRLPEASEEQVSAYVGDLLYKYNFVDLFGGMGAPRMALEFSNSNKNIYLSQLGIGGPANGPHGSVRWSKLKTAGYGLAGARLGGYGRGHFGAALEFSAEKRNIARQGTSFTLDGAQKGFTFNSDDYLTLTSVYAMAEILFRFTKRTMIEPYVGAGGGLSYNRVVMPAVGGLRGSGQVLTAPTKEAAIGFVVNVPAGLRVQLTDGIQVFTEARYQRNTFVFDRGGISGERDTLTLSGLYYNFGLSVNF